MSATLDSAPLVEYFTEVSKTGQVPVIKCELNLFDVKTFYLDWIEKNLNFKVTFIIAFVTIFLHKLKNAKFYKRK